MAVTLDTFKAFVGANAASGLYAQMCLASALSQVTGYVGAQRVEIPDEDFDLAVLLTAQSLFSRRDKDAGGAPQWQSVDGAPLTRPAIDPMRAVYPILDRWMVTGL